MAQTKEHVFLSRTLGVNQLMVAVNKMDMVKFDQKRFEEVKKDVENLLKSVGYKPAEVMFLPLASFPGDNVAKKSANMPWYTGPTLLEALDKLKEPEKSMFDVWTPKLKEFKFGSEEYKQALDSMGEALKHHYENNLFGKQNRTL